MKTLHSYLLVFGMLLVLVGCNMPSSGVSGATQGNATPIPGQSTSIPSGSGACANQYFPSKAGATWTYANTSPMAPASTTTRSITDIGPTGFVVNDATTPDINVAVKWSCQSGNLAMLDSATIMAADTVLAVSSVTSTGYLIPADISVGSSWSEKLELVGTGEISGTTRMIQQNDTQIACTADSKESIKVQAGTFDAVKVTCVYTITTTTTIDANSGAPVTNNITITDWYVPGVGSVKTEKTGDIVETHELTGYSIP
jgi:hypothetical protein